MNEQLIGDLFAEATRRMTGSSSREFSEKFAELIVQECLACAQGAGLADDVAVRNGLGFNDGISEAVTHMKQHFGVEE